MLKLFLYSHRASLRHPRCFSGYYVWSGIGLSVVEGAIYRLLFGSTLNVSSREITLSRTLVALWPLSLGHGRAVWVPDQALILGPQQADTTATIGARLSHGNPPATVFLPSDIHNFLPQSVLLAPLMPLFCRPTYPSTPSLGPRTRPSPLPRRLCIEELGRISDGVGGDGMARNAMEFRTGSSSYCGLQCYVYITLVLVLL
jgi:hypothetical protein